MSRQSGKSEWYVRCLVKAGWLVRVVWVRRENNEEADQLVKEQKRQLLFQKITKAPSRIRFGDTPLMTVKEACSLANRRTSRTHLDNLSLQTSRGARPFVFLIIL